MVSLAGIKVEKEGASVPQKFAEKVKDKPKAKQEEIFATLVGAKLLEQFYQSYKQDWKLVGHKAKVFLKKEGIKYSEVEHLIELD